MQILFSIKIQFFSHRNELFKTREKTRIRGKKRRRFEIISKVDAEIVAGGVRKTLLGYIEISGVINLNPEKFSTPGDFYVTGIYGAARVLPADFVNGATFPYKSLGHPLVPE